MPLLTPKQVDDVVRNLVQSFLGRADEVGMSYRDLAPLVGVTHQTLHNWANGTMPGELHTLIALLWAKARLDGLTKEEIDAMKHNQAQRREWVRKTVAVGR